jgi:hypothetical protein
VSTRYAFFCSDPLNPRAPEPDFEAEVQAARDQEFEIRLIHDDELDHRRDPVAALGKFRLEAGRGVYRGWMLRSDAYAALHAVLRERGVQLLTDPIAYQRCHHATGSYEALQEYMPTTKWVDAALLDDKGSILSTLGQFGSSPVIIKDWVKSQASGYWLEACFIPDASNFERATQVIERFRELQGDSLVGGLVIKSYVPLKTVGQPALEYRAFIVDGAVVGCWPRSEAARAIPEPPAALLQDVAARIPSPFASADFALDENDNWWLLEVGDGQVSGLPDPSAAHPLFVSLNQALSK